jgi:transposase
MIIGVDYHPSFQQIAFFVEETGECGEQELKHCDGQAEKFYRDLRQRGISVRVGMEATGYSRWFERLLAELGFEVWIGDPAEIKTKRVKKHKTDREDARLMRKLLLENRFPRIWVPDPENRDLRASRPIASVAIHWATGGCEAYTARKQAVKIQLRKLGSLRCRRR